MKIFFDFQTGKEAIIEKSCVHSIDRSRDKEFLVFYSVFKPEIIQGKSGSCLLVLPMTSFLAYTTSIFIPFMLQETHSLFLFPPIYIIP